jgi:hypothetical protein
VDTAWVGVIGALGGAGVTGTVAVLLDRSRAGREREARLHDDRFRLYLSILQTADGYQQALEDLFAAHAREEAGEEVNQTILVNYLDAVEAWRTPLRSAELLAGRKAREEAARVWSALVDVTAERFKAPSPDTPAAKELRELRPGALSLPPARAHCCQRRQRKPAARRRLIILPKAAQTRRDDNTRLGNDRHARVVRYPLRSPRLDKRPES